MTTAKSQITNKKIRQELFVVDYLNSGFSYIELILYVAILGLMVTTLTHFGITIITGSAKSATDEEVSGNVRFISEKILYEIRNASGLVSFSPSSITLCTSFPSSPCTATSILSFSSGNITINKGVGSTQLNSTNVSISNFSFTNYTSVDGFSEHVGFSFTANDNFTSTRQEYIKEIPIEASAEIRSN